MTLNFLGIDLGTGSVKAVIVAEDGHVLGRGSAEYALHHPRPGFAEQEPDDWWEGTIAAVRAAIEDAGDVAIAGIALSGQMHGTVFIDGQHQPIGPAIIWADTRSARQVEEITRLVGAQRLIELTGSPLAVGFQAATIRWVQQEDGERWSRVRKILLPKDYLGWRLTGVLATEPSDASSTLLLDVRTRDWADEMLDALDLRAGCPPRAPGVDRNPRRSRGRRRRPTRFAAGDPGHRRRRGRAPGRACRWGGRSGIDAPDDQYRVTGDRPDRRAAGRSEGTHSLLV